MLLDDLVNAIQTVQQRIHEHGNSLSQNEYRTRLTLIDPILNALGWNVADPKLVMPEYQVGSGRADYALLGEDGKPLAFIEAKRLGEMAEASRHETQLFTYAVTQGVRYAALTDGNRWIFDNLTARFSDGESRLLDLNISSESGASMYFQVPVALATDISLRTTYKTHRADLCYASKNRATIRGGRGTYSRPDPFPSHISSFFGMDFSRQL